MPSHLKALPIILAATLILFWIANAAFPEAARAGEIRRQRWAVMLVTAAAFVSPSIWVYSALMPVIVLAFMMPADDRGTRAAALWAMLLLVVPNVGAYIQGFGGIGNFFEMQHARTLTFALLLPALLTMQPDPRRPKPLGVATDWFVLAYFGVQMFVILPYASRTDLIRQAFVLTIDTLLPYWIFSRAFTTPQGLREAMRGFMLTAMLIGLLAVFESVKRWPIYDAVPEAWHIDWDLTIFLERAGFLRAKASAGHSLVLGFVLVVGLGLWGALKAEVPRRGFLLLGNLAFALGLAASLARGSWLGAILLLALRAVLGEGAVKRLLLTVVVVAAAIGVATQVPALQVVIDMLPFVGHVDSENVEYRQRLLEISLSLIASSPWLGVPGYMNYMEELRQGQGIIDIVNSYVQIALNTGLIGVACFVGMFLATIAGLFRLRRQPAANLEGAHVASHLIATTLAAMSVIVTTSSIVVIPQVMFMLVGMGVACARVYGVAGSAMPTLHAGMAQQAVLRRQ
ncbi:MAG TPA: O-antigen ligase family protein [Ideonella sp.]|nr:O-antigen ligase family protein [Ideonella sp.]